MLYVNHELRCMCSVSQYDAKKWKSIRCIKILIILSPRRHRSLLAFHFDAPSRNERTFYHGISLDGKLKSRGKVNKKSILRWKKRFTTSLYSADIYKYCWHIQASFSLYLDAVQVRTLFLTKYIPEMSHK